ncbi:AAA family ATPase [Nocardioides sp. SYSU D00038]|uniref:AAA family ATPase n=1 Tax=Nocardioides sp. SYSU D00038 TaxID=2812554 RepID=UPI001968A461|nr:SMC family ATPase [Nocardioides sp. SYSU D00038]
MRLHHLEVTAFGPFATTARVDFDALSEAGLFLLSGATGAGKTSVLDAVCFALYGEVPGDRNAAKRLRSDHAEPHVAPRVALEATLAGRRFRLVRSPAWERPKKRGSGTTTEHAHVTVSERLGGDWVPLTTRLDEAGHLVSGLVGMNVTQFTQVALLPQGQFQAFLRASSKDRQALLQRLFRSSRFEDVERWLRDRRTSLRRASESEQRRVADLVSRVSETTETPWPTEWDLDDLSEPAGAGALLAWTRDHVARTTTAAAEVEQRDAAAVTAELAARTALEEARSDHERRERRRRAEAEQAALAEDEPRRATEREALARARRAAAVVPLRTLAVDTARALVEAEEAAAVAVREALHHLDAPDLPSVAGRLAEVGAAAEAARSARPRERRLHDQLAATREALAGQERAAAELDRVVAAADALPREVEELRERHAAAREAAPLVVVAAAEVTRLTEAVAARDELGAVETRLSAARAEHEEARLATLARREALLDVREARLTGMAAEIAGALAVGASCPVCGSCDHPQPAVPAPGAPGADAEKAAQRALDDANATELARQLAVRDLETRRESLLERLAATDPATLDDRLAAGRAEHDRLRTLAGDVEALRERLDRATAQGEELAARRRELEAAHARGTAELEARQQEVAALRDELVAVLDGTGAAGLDELLETLEHRIGCGTACQEAVAERDRARRRAEDARARLEAQARSVGFASAEEATGAHLPDVEQDRLEAVLAEHERRRASAAAVLAELGDAPDSEPADLAALEAAHARAASALAALRAEGLRLIGVHRRLTELVSELEEALRRWAPLRADLVLTDRLASFVDGTSPDNRWRMRLSAYVLSHRLRQVVAAANERLERMSDQRYELEHSHQRGAGENRGGLSLVVRDAWSGETRDPATLSGGETFVVSLALALGLADVITHETGGAVLDTLFVDEGFGSLDADTLDDVMGTLDSLRDGGRVVGVVSHVAEMRDRIPTQLVLTKSRSGSSISLRRPGLG